MSIDHAINISPIESDFVDPYSVISINNYSDLMLALNYKRKEIMANCRKGSGRKLNVTLPKNINEPLNIKRIIVGVKSRMNCNLRHFTCPASEYVKKQIILEPYHGAYREYFGSGLPK